jgi:hypothetical protein
MPFLLVAKTSQQHLETAQKFDLSKIRYIFTIIILVELGSQTLLTWESEYVENN